MRDDGRDIRALEPVLAAMAGRRVLIVGDVMLDEYLWGAVRRVSPEAPVPVVDLESRTYRPGGAANTAANVVALGGRASLGGVVGRDAGADDLGEALRRLDVDASGLVADPGRPTTTKTRVIANGQQVARVDREQRRSPSPEQEAELVDWMTVRIDHADACILSDYAKGVVTPGVARALVERARMAGKPVVIDPKGPDWTKYRGATVVTPNIHEAERALNRDLGDDADLDAAARQLAELLDGSALCITRGAQGMLLYAKGLRVARVPALARTVFDVTGAGDTVVGALALALAAGASLETAARVATRAAAVVVGKVGTAVATVDEVAGNGLAS